jgi:hypothetical protein
MERKRVAVLKELEPSILRQGKLAPREIASPDGLDHPCRLLLLQLLFREGHTHEALDGDSRLMALNLLVVPTRATQDVPTLATGRA